MARSRVKCIIWDVAGTLLKLETRLTEQALGRLSAKDPAHIEELFWGKYHAKISSFYLFEVGRINEEEFLIIIRHVLDLNSEVSDDQIRRAFTSYLYFSRDTWALLHYLKEQGFIQGLLSNNNPFCRFMLDQFPTLDLENSCWQGTEKKKGGVMDFHVFSYRVGTAKPYRKIFAKAFAAARKAWSARGNAKELMPEECLFFDDVEKYADAARKFGMRAVHVQNGYADIGNGLRRFGILTPYRGWQPKWVRESLESRKGS